MTTSIFLLAGVLSFLAVRMAPCAPEVYVSNRLDIADGDVTPSRSEGTDFGSAGLGRPGVRRTFVVGNTGPDPLTVGAVSVPGGFTLVNDLVGPISNGLAETFTVRLSTDTIGTHTGAVSFTTSDPDETVFDFVIRGRVNPAGSGATLVTQVADVAVSPGGQTVSIDLHRHFDDIGTDGTLVRMNFIDFGAVDLELTDHVTPITVSNFLNYVTDGDYIDSFLHRSIPSFVLQGGGYCWPEGPNPIGVPTDPPIPNEFDNWFDPTYGGRAAGTPINVEWTVSMAKLGGDPDSATSQFFISIADNSENLDSQNGGFTVFATVIRGTSVVEAIEACGIANVGAPFDALPVHNIVGGQTNVYRANLVMIDAADVIDELELAVVSNSAPGLLSPSINAEGILTLTTTSGQVGVAEITIRGTDGDGAWVEDGFQVTLLQDRPLQPVEITSLTTSNGVTALAWACETGTWCVAQRATNLATLGEAKWLDIGSCRLAPDCVTVDTNVAGATFYRVLVPHVAETPYP